MSRVGASVPSGRFRPVWAAPSHWGGKVPKRPIRPDRPIAEWRLRVGDSRLLACRRQSGTCGAHDLGTSSESKASSPRLTTEKPRRSASLYGT